MSAPPHYVKTHASLCLQFERNSVTAYAAVSTAEQENLQQKDT